MYQIDEETVKERIDKGYYNADTYTSYSLDRKAYRAKQSELYGEFQHDLIEAYGVVEHPKAIKAFEMAWADGHSEGWHAVKDKFEELVDLLK